MLVGFKVRLYPTEEQEVLFKKSCGVARFAYNESLSYSNNRYEDTGSYTSIQQMIEHIQDLKYTNEYSWIREVPEIVTKDAVKNLDKAFRKYFSDIKSGRLIDKSKGRPRFKKKGKCKESFATRADRFQQLDSRHIKLVGFKSPVRIKPYVFPSRLYNLRVIFDDKYWYLSFNFEAAEQQFKTSGEVIGVDLGVKELMVTSDGQKVKNINNSRTIKKLERRKKKLQRHISRKYESNKTGKKYNKTRNILKLESKVRLIDRRLKGIRDNYIHEATMNLVSRAKVLCIEDLNVQGMMKNKYLSKYIQEQEFGKVRQYLTYKCQGYGVKLIVADRFFASTKICNFCGNKKKYMSLSERLYVCDKCGYSMDRDLNAAYNLRDYALSQIS